MWFLRRRSKPAALPPVSVYMFSDRLETRDVGLSFDASIRVEWRRDVSAPGELAGPRTAVRIIRPIVERAIKKASVLRLHAAEDAVDAALQGQLPFRRDGVEVVRAGVTLTVDQEAIRVARQIEKLLHEQELDELARRQVKARADFFREVILSDPASAHIYALLEIPQRVGKSVGVADIDALVQRVNEWHPQSRWIVIAQVLNDFIKELSDSGRKDLMNIIGSAIGTLGTSEQVDELSRAASLAQSHFKSEGHARHFDDRSA